MATSGKGNLVGIDLGTTMSVIARLDDDGSAVAIPNSAGEPLTPSVIYLDGQTALVGKTAREAAALDPSRVAMAVKRDMGEPQYHRPVDGRTFRPETLSAIVLRKLKLDAERRIGPISRAVITVPAFFDDSRRTATEDAGRIAGLEVLDIINEPTAAALSYAMQAHRAAGRPGNLLDIPGGEMTAVVYDLGGGTFDCTCVRLLSKRFETLATDGEVHLGGRDWDQKIVDFVAEQFKREFDADPRVARGDALAALAEKTKILLSKLPAAPLEFSYRGNTLNLLLTRQQFESLSADLVTRTRIVTDLVVRKQAGLRFDQVDRYLLVGGSTHMPMVKQMLRELTGAAPDDSLDVDQVVAQGAAIHAGILAAKSEGDLEIADELRDQLGGISELNVNAHSLGVAALRNGRVISAKLIPKNSQLPRAASQVFHLRHAGMREIDVKVVEGEADEAAQNIVVGECRITGLPAGLPRHAPVQVRLSYAANGLVQVMALDMTHGTFAEANIVRQNRMTEEDIQRETALVDSLMIE